MNTSKNGRGFEDVRAILGEIAEMHRQSEADRRRETAERQKSAADFDRRLAESEAAREKSEEDFYRRLAESEAARKKSAEDFDRRMAVFDRRLDRWQKQFGDYTNTESVCLEDEFRDAILAAGEIDGVKIDVVHCRTQAVARGGKTLGEYDLTAENGEKMFVGEIKRKLTAEKVREFHQKLLRYRKHFPAAARGMQIYGMVGGEQIGEDAADTADELGMYVLRLKNNRKLAVTPPKIAA